MFNEFEQITLDRELSQDELQRYLFRLVEELNFRISAVENNEIDVAELTKDLPDVIKGKDGDDGVTYYTWIKYSPNADGSNMTNLPDANTKYIGISYNNLSPTESSSPTDYTWSRLKGEQGIQGVQGIQGETGAQGVGVTNITNQYYYSTSPTELSGGGWSTDMPTYDATKYLWIRQKIDYSDGNSTYTTAAHDAELDAAIQRITESEGDISEITVRVGGIEVTVEGTRTDIGTLDDRLTANEEATASTSDNLTELQSIIAGMSTDINGLEVTVDNYEAIVAQLRQANSELTSQLAERTQRLNDIISQFNNYVAEEGQYMRYGDDGLELGAEDSQFKTVIDNRRMAFMDGTTVTAYVSGEMFNMNNAEVKGTLKKGGYEEHVQENGGVFTVWVGV